MIQASDRYRVNRFHRSPLPIVNVVGFRPMSVFSFKSSIKELFNTFKRELYKYKFFRLRSDHVTCPSKAAFWLKMEEWEVVEVII